MERGTAPVCLHRRIRIVVTGFDRNRHFFSYFVLCNTVLCGDGTNGWADEQPSEEIKKYVELQIADKPFDAILSHTCPYKYIPREMFLSGIDQSMVDDSTERWLDSIEERVSYRAWFCGHWHTDKRIDRMHFLFHSFETDEALHDGIEGRTQP